MVARRTWAPGVICSLGWRPLRAGEASEARGPRLVPACPQQASALFYNAKEFSLFGITTDPARMLRVHFRMRRTVGASSFPGRIDPPGSGAPTSVGMRGDRALAYR